MPKFFTRIYYFGLLLILFALSDLSFADAPTSDPQIPVQQFVTAENSVITPPASAEQSAPLVPVQVAPAAPIIPSSSITNPPLHTSPPLEPQAQPSASLPPLPPPVLPASAEVAAVQRVLDNQRVTAVPGTEPAAYFSQPADAPIKSLPNTGVVGGLSQENFIRCQKLGSQVCSQASNDTQFKNCLFRLKNQPACLEFVYFAKAIGMGIKDDVDLIQYYEQANMDLIHVTHWGANFPGEYYALGRDGKLANLTFGPEIQAINISKDLHYPEIVERFPKVGLWSGLVDQRPESVSPPSGSGLRLMFRFQLRNGCHVCERAGYANVAYDFSSDGTLQQVQVISLDPTPLP